MFSTVLTLFAAIAFTMAQSPTCYTTGNSDAAACQQFIGDFCGTVSGYSIPGRSSSSRCFTANGHRCDFLALNTASNETFVDSGECGGFLNDTINACPSGGFGKPSINFSFTVDPNDGACGPNVEPGR